MKPKDDDKQQAIARATLALVERVGLSGLTMAAIAREAGIATGTLYVYHRSKEELLNALYEQVKGALVGLIDVDIDAATPFRTRFQMNWTRLLRHRLAHGPEAVFMDHTTTRPGSARLRGSFPRASRGGLRFLTKPRAADREDARP